MHAQNALMCCRAFHLSRQACMCRAWVRASWKLLMYALASYSLPPLLPTAPHTLAFTFLLLHVSEPSLMSVPLDV
jgi:hypothetical protein